MEYLPTVSVVLPLTKISMHARASIGSVLSQTYKNVELVLVHCGAADRDVVHRAWREIEEEHPARVSYLHERSSSRFAGLNRGVRHMQGDFVAFIGEGDLYPANRIERQIAFHRQLARPNAVLYSDWSCIDEEGRSTHDVRLPGTKLARSPLLAALGRSINASTALVPAEVMRATLPFDARCPHSQDYAVWYKAVRRFPSFHMAEVLLQQRGEPSHDVAKRGAIRHGEELWRDMIFGLTPVEAAQIAGSSLRFHREMDELLSTMPYPDARSAVRAAAETCVGETCVSVVLYGGGDLDEFRASVETVLAQTHRNLDILLAPATDDTSALDRLAERDPRIKVLPRELRQPRLDVAGTVSRASGDYVCFLVAGDLFDARKVHVQLEETMQTGAAVSFTSYDGRSGECILERSSGVGAREMLIERSRHPSTMMVHRIVVESGAFRPGVDGADPICGAIRWARSNPVLSLPYVLTH
jgi:glycosyltransferase involved in cell wall biosynthesis